MGLNFKKKDETNNNDFYKEEGNFLGSGDNFNQPIDDQTANTKPMFNPYDVSNTSDNYQDINNFEVPEKKAPTKKIILIGAVVILVIILAGVLFVFNSKKLNSISVDVSPVIYLNEKGNISAKAVGEGDLSNTKYNFSISDANIASVESQSKVGKSVSNVISGTALGEFTIAVSGSLKNKSVSTVTKNMAICNRISEGNKSITVQISKTENIDLGMGDSALCYSALTYEIADTSIVSVTNGVITGLKEGTTTITAKDDRTSAIISVNVLGEADIIKASAISLDTKKVELSKGQTKQFTLSFVPANVSDTSVSWNIDNTNVATVSQDGTITAVSNGSCIITATTTNGLRDKAIIIVK